MGYPHLLPYLSQKPPRLEVGKGNEFINSFPACIGVIAPNVNDAVKLQLLEQCLPEAGVAEVKRRREGYQRGDQPPPTYQDLWNWVIRNYQGDPKVDTLRALWSLAPVHRGKLTSDSWLDYVQQFRLNFDRVRTEVREEEVLEWAWKHVPIHIRKSVRREEDKRNRRNPVLNLTGVSRIPREQVIKLLGEAIADQQQLVQMTLTTEDHGVLPGVPTIRTCS